MKDTITIPRELFERLTEHAIDLAGEWHWKRNEPRKGYADVVEKLDADIALAVELRDQAGLPSGD